MRDDGWVPCSCHPETCCHSDGLVYRPKVDFILDTKERDIFENDKKWIPAKQVVDVLSEYEIKSEIDFEGRVRPNSYDLKLESYNYYRATKHTTKYFYTITSIINAILKYQSKIRKNAYRDFKLLL